MEEPDLLTPALVKAMARALELPELIQTADALKRRGQGAAAAALYATFVQHNPDHPLLYAVLFNHAVALTEQGALPGARECLTRSLALNPDFLPSRINLGCLFDREGDAAQAVAHWSAALEKLAAVTGPAIGHKTTALNQSARVLENASQDAAAEALLRQSLELDSRQPEAVQHLLALRQRQCEWPVVLPSERVDRLTLMKGLSPLSAAALTDDPLLQLALAAHYNRETVGLPEGAHTAWPRACSVAAGRGARLRIGYLSSDLREHAVGYLLSEVLGLHDRAAVEVFAYYCGPASRDPLHAHFRATADHFEVLTGPSDAAAAEKIAADGIQVLVDLNGYTREARLGLVALRPAPVIVNWLGFPGSMGSPYHHYLIADDFIVPPAQEVYYSERVLRLPCYQPSNRSRAVSPRRPTRAEAGLPAEGAVFCSFNGVHKITRPAFGRWMEILARVPGSVLWLLDSTAEASRRLRAEAAARGVPGERLVFAPKLANPDHLARYPLADLFLDTAPYGAHTTASDALWMGVPALTLAGRSFASRVCGSLVRAAGLPELVCETPAAFVEKAVTLGLDPAALRPLRERLVAGRDACALFDVPSLVRGLEAHYLHAWDSFVRGALPQPDLANLEEYLDAGARLDHEERELLALDGAGYHALWRDLLARRHALRPLAPDRRFSPAGR